MKLLLIENQSNFDLVEPEDSSSGTYTLGIFYGWNAIKSAIKKEVKSLFREWVDGYGGDEEAEELFAESKGYLKDSCRELDKLPASIDPKELEKLTNPKYIYPMVEIADIDIVNDDENIHNCRFYVVAVK